MRKITTAEIAINPPMAAMTLISRMRVTQRVKRGSFRVRLTARGRTVHAMEEIAPA